MLPKLGRVPGTTCVAGGRGFGGGEGAPRFRSRYAEYAGVREPRGGLPVPDLQRTAYTDLTDADARAAMQQYRTAAGFQGRSLHRGPDSESERGRRFGGGRAPGLAPSADHSKSTRAWIPTPTPSPPRARAQAQAGTGAAEGGAGSAAAGGDPAPHAALSLSFAERMRLKREGRL